MAGEVDVQLNDEHITEIFNQIEGAAVISYSAEYAPYVEFPTSYSGGSQPPFDAIYEWVGRKWNDLGSGIKTDDNGNPLSQEEVAWRMVYIIKENGTEGVHFGQRALEQMRQDADRFAQQYQGSNDPNAADKLLHDLGDYGFQVSQDIVSDEATDTGNLLQSGAVSYTNDPEEVPEDGN